MKMKKYISLFLIINFVFFAGAYPTYPNAYVDVNGTLVLGPKSLGPVVAAASLVSLADLVFDSEEDFEEEDDEKEEIRVNKNELFRALQLKK